MPIPRLPNRDRYLDLLEFVKPTEYGRYFLEEVSPGQLTYMKSEAIDDENYELCSLIQRAEWQYNREFKVSFYYIEGQCDNAVIVSFFKNGVTYYHADTFIGDEEDGQQVMLYQNKNGGWISTKRGFNKQLAAAIGKAIDKYEKTRSIAKGSPRGSQDLPNDTARA